MKLYYIAITLLMLTSCCCQQKSKEVKIPAYIFEEIAHLSSTPDSLLTSAQIQLKSTILDIVKTSIKIEQNKLVNKSSPADFEKRGLSKYYYYALEKNIDEINTTSLGFYFQNIQAVYDAMLQSFESKKE